MFKNVIAIALLTVVAVLAGCSSNGGGRSGQYGPLTYIHKDKSVDIGSYVQWNDEYAVTAKHVKNVPDVVYVSTDYDLVFFKHKSTVPLEWADTQLNEDLFAKGFPHYPVRRKENVIKATSVDMNVTIDGTPDYLLFDGVLVSGMSGGPVFNRFNKVVGMNIGYTNKLYTIHDKTQVYSVYLSYKGIQKEWNKFQKVNQY